MAAERIVAWISIPLALAFVVSLVPGTLATTLAELVANDNTEFIVGFQVLRPDLKEGDVYLGGKVRSVSDQLDSIMVETNVPTTLITQAFADTNVRYLESNYAAYHAAFGPNDPQYVDGTQYGPQLIRAPEAKLIPRSSWRIAVPIDFQ